MCICKVDGCNNKSKTKGFCNLHYQRMRRLGSATAPLKIAPKNNGEMCDATNCDRKAEKRGLCIKHYHRLRRLGVLETGRPDRLPNLSQKKCKVDGCNKNSMALHLCIKHYAKFKKYGDPLLGGIQDGRSKEWRINKIGYIEKFDPVDPYAASNGFVFQHRKIMGECVGRVLRKDESVHHKNGDRTDNRIENLELWSKAQPAGQRVQDKVAWAKEILQLYGDVVDKLL